MTTTRRFMLGSHRRAVHHCRPSGIRPGLEGQVSGTRLRHCSGRKRPGVTERMVRSWSTCRRKLGVKVTLRNRRDYAAVIEGQRAGSIHIGDYGPSSYIRATHRLEWWRRGLRLDACFDGSTGYFAVAYAKTAAAGAKLEDFKGKNLCLVDPNSTSGKQCPLFSMSKMGIEPDKYFAKVTNAGSHENAVMAVQQGTCDVAFNWWNSETTPIFPAWQQGHGEEGLFKIVFKSEKFPALPMPC